MARFHIQSDEREVVEVEADNWMGALGDALQRLEVRNLGGVDCDVLASGDIRVSSPAGVFVIHELRDDATPAGSLPADLRLELPPELVDAPEPQEAPAWRAYEDNADQLVAVIADRARAVLDAETAEDAAGAALDVLMEYVPAESAAVLLADRRTRDLRFVAARGPRSRGLAGLPVPSGRGIAGLTVRAGIALTVREVPADPRHYAEVDRRTGYRTAAIVSVPIRGPRGAIGCLQLLNPFADTAFQTWHQAAAIVVAERLAERLG